MVPLPARLKLSYPGRPGRRAPAGYSSHQKIGAVPFRVVRFLLDS
jgi:hypothetical protein